MRSLLLIIPICFLLFAVIANADDILEQKKELEKIKNEIDQSKKNLDSLKQSEKNILNQLSEYEQRESMNKTVITRLNKELSSLRENIDDAAEKLNDAKESYNHNRQRYRDNIRSYYTGLNIGTDFQTGKLWNDLDAFRRKVYLKSLAQFEKQRLSEASDALDETEKEYSGLVDQEKSVDRVKNQKQSEYAIITSKMKRSEKELTRVRRKKADEADRLITLSEAARQMEDLLARLERDRMGRQDGNRAGIDFDFETGNFVSYKGKLPTPLSGKVINSFGWKTDRITNLKSFSPGIEIEGRANSHVVAISSGVVAYSGYIRGYGNFIILEHEDGFYSTYAGLADMYVIKNQLISRGERVGYSSDGKIKFELRKGKEPLDPVEWINIDAFK